jgi:hypothetical protein
MSHAEVQCPFCGWIGKSYQMLKSKIKWADGRKSTQYLCPMCRGLISEVEES